MLYNSNRKIQMLTIINQILKLIYIQKYDNKKKLILKILTQLQNIHYHNLN